MAPVSVLPGKRIGHDRRRTPAEMRFAGINRMDGLCPSRK